MKVFWLLNMCYSMPSCNKLRAELWFERFDFEWNALQDTETFCTYALHRIRAGAIIRSFKGELQEALAAKITAQFEAST